MNTFAPLTPEQLWEQCKMLIKIGLQDDTEYERWFLGVSCRSYVEGVLTLAIPTSYVLEHITQHYNNVLWAAARRCFGEEVLLRSIITEEEEKIHATQQAQWQAQQAYQQRTTGRVPQSKEERIAEAAKFDTGLYPQYTFDTYIQSTANRMAFNTAMDIATRPEQTLFNPFFLFGASGTGKTHLINALGHKMRELYPEKKVRYVSAHQFLEEFVSASMAEKKSRADEFYAYYQGVDLLIVDDIQELGGGKKTKTQNSLFHVLNDLTKRRCHVVLASDTPPAELEGFDDRLRYRFSQGVTVDLQRPDTALRRAVLHAKMRKHQIEFPTEVVDFIVENVCENVRAIEGVVTSLLAYSIQDNAQFTVEMARSVIARVIKIKEHDLTPESIIHKTCEHFGVKRTDLMSKKRTADLVRVRHIAIYLCQKHTKLSATELARRFGLKDHSTISHAIKKVRLMLNTDEGYRHTFEGFEQTL